MKFDAPATTNPIDRQRFIGQPLDRIEGQLKVTGSAPYAYERHEVVPDQAYGYIIGAGIAKGRIKAMDLDAARAAPGVLGIVTAANAGKLGKGKRNTARLLGGPEIEHYDQAIAIVVAESFEMARAAALLIRPDYEAQPGQFDLAAAQERAVKPESGDPDSGFGDFARDYAQAPVTLDETYTTPDQSHAMMEPHASIAAWKDGAVTIWTSNQMIAWGKADVAETLGLPPEKVRLDSPYVGGGFGGKLFLRADCILAALAAREVGRPVKVALTRPMIFNNTTHRPATRQRIRLGAAPDGRLLAIAHESWSGNLPGGATETAVHQTRLLYAAPGRLTRTRLARLDLPEGNAMRAPGEASGLMALEVAMDEMAERLGMDPVQFRILNDTRVDPENPGRPFSQRHLVECLKRGAQRFGWAQRQAKPGQRREGGAFIGLGVAAGIRNNLLTKSAARVRLTRDCRLIVETDMTDIGTGSYTIIAQTAAEMLGLPMAQVEVRLGDSDSPVSAGSGGQWGANNATAGVYAACVGLRQLIVARLGLNEADAVFADGRVQSGGNRTALAQAARQGELVAEDGIEYGDLAERYQQSTFAAHFAEVSVDAATAEIRVRRMLAVCDAGRILNPKSARSQVIGAMTMGVGAALMEELAVDHQRGYFANHDLAGYEVPVHADIPHQEVVFLDEPDPLSSPMKAKGVGELGLCGAAAAVANAVYNATGVRVRDYPVTLDKLLAAMPA
ncbi:aldehyde oxidoreductase molybdenum-binding subunit PaoC [Acidocella facilis]|uniref:aldehyde oxidoreductase molybdenum-binding subunit PaoC n=1 Tax=Acidocella facilis TaxID=525 RepID=UPI000478E282|nr:aldehyde oxidoreductase molybdenum-binding subunit PaoC [Acidocella facilis]